MPEPAPPVEPWTLALSPAGRLHVVAAAAPGDGVRGRDATALRAAFDRGHGHGLLELGARAADAMLPAPVAFFRDFARLVLTRICSVPDVADDHAVPTVPPPRAELDARRAAVPPMAGAEYLTTDVLEALWQATRDALAAELAAARGTVQDWLRTRSPVWNVVGRVHFHLAERKDDERRPFAFLATFTSGVGAGARAQHRPLGQAIAASAGARDKDALLTLLTPVHRAAERSELLRTMVEDRSVFQPLAWTPAEAYRFLRDVPAFEAAGVVVRVPDWWRARRAPRPAVRITVGARPAAGLGVDAMVDFDARVCLGEEAISDAEWQALLAGTDGLVRLRGQWVEIDRAQLKEVLAHWRTVQSQMGRDGIGFAAAMRLLAGAEIVADDAAPPDAVTDWSAVHAGPWLAERLAELRAGPATATLAATGELRARLRPYQAVGVAWLRFLVQLGLGACLADDMGLGKTIQVLALLLELRHAAGERRPSLLVVPASLLGNWQDEIARFAPSLMSFVAHPSATPADRLASLTARDLAATDLVITTYGATLRHEWLTRIPWHLVILDEAQAIKNPGARQTRAVKAIAAGARARVALTGTPIENRLGDLWSLFDFLDPGLLGSAAEFGRFARRLQGGDSADFGPLRRLVQPYILRRLKTDKSTIADLPDKTEVRAFCALTKAQAALYQQAVAELKHKLGSVAGIERRGVVLAFLVRFKQICNHPSQWLGDNAYDPAASGKFARLTEIAEAIAERQDKALVFTQFREMTEPLALHLARVFGRPGLVLSGTTPVRARKQLVDRFQGDEAVPFFVLSVKAGGTGLNLTAASHVVHFDRWWNPAVEDQATDRAFRIGQKRNVLVHKFVVRGTIEERIDAMIADKRSVAQEILGGGSERMITEMSDRELLEFVRLDVQRAAADL